MHDVRLRSLTLATLIGAASGLLAGQVQLRYNAKAGYRETGPARVVKLKARASPDPKPAGEPKKLDGRHRCSSLLVPRLEGGSVRSQPARMT